MISFSRKYIAKIFSLEMYFEAGLFLSVLGNQNQEYVHVSVFPEKSLNRLVCFISVSFQLQRMKCI